MWRKRLPGPWPNQQGKWHLLGLCNLNFLASQRLWFLQQKNPSRLHEVEHNSWDFSVLETLRVLNWFSLRSTSRIWGTSFLGGQDAELHVSKMWNAWKLSTGLLNTKCFKLPFRSHNTNTSVNYIIYFGIEKQRALILKVVFRQHVVFPIPSYKV